MPLSSHAKYSPYITHQERSVPVDGRSETMQVVQLAVPWIPPEELRSNWGTITPAGRHKFKQARDKSKKLGEQEAEQAILAGAQTFEHECELTVAVSGIGRADVLNVLAGYKWFIDGLENGGLLKDDKLVRFATVQEYPEKEAFSLIIIKEI